MLGATDRRLKAVVAQVPTIDGHPSGLRRGQPSAVAELDAGFGDDDRAQLRGEPPATQQIVHQDGMGVAAYSGLDEIKFYLQPVPERATWNIVRPASRTEIGLPAAATWGAAGVILTRMLATETHHAIQRGASPAEPPARADKTRRLKRSDRVLIERATRGF